MDYIWGVGAYEGKKPSAVTLGKFDGLHRGHQKLIEKIKYYGEKEHLHTVVVAFDMSATRKRSRSVLITNEERKDILTGEIDYLISCPFTEEILHMEAEDFIRDVLVKKLHAARIVVGTDFHFGYQKKGDFRLLKRYEDRYCYRVEVVEKECLGKREISSTYIKEELVKGNMEMVSRLLGRPYVLRGIVKHGAKLGRKLDMPTMNLYPAEEKILPPHGVYAAVCKVEGQLYGGIANLGRKPTVQKESAILLETHLLSFEKEMYGEEIEVALLRFVRPEKKFASVEELKAAMKADMESAKTYLRKKI